MTYFLNLNFDKKNYLKYRPEIDGLRAIAVLPVIFFHSNLKLFSGGFTGVDVFFVISGYLITSIILQDIYKKKFNLIHFYERRARRILPILFIVTIFTLVASYFILTPKNLISLSNSAISIPFFSSNFYFWSERGYFNEAASLKPLIHTWSLSVEEQFYLIFPLILIYIKSFKKILYIFLITLFFFSLILSYYLTLLHLDTAFFFPITRMWELLAGSFCAIFLFRTSFKFSLFFSEILSLLGLLLIFYSYVKFNEETLFPYLNAMLPVAGCFLFIISSQSSNIIKKIFSNKIIVYVGLISYSLYLWHYSLFSLSRHLEIFEKNKITLIILSFLISVITYHFVEKKFRNQSLLSRKVIINISLVCTIIILVISFIYKSNSGFIKRYSEENQALFKQSISNKNYNQKYFDENELKEFTSRDSYRVVVIGDSTAKDFMNIINESGKFKEYEFSTKQINSECGNIFLEDYQIINKFIPKNRIERCNFLGRYEGEKIEKILKEADEIWIISLWRDWSVKFIPLSIQNLKKKYQKPIRVFGIKNFGDINLDKVIRIKQKDRINFNVPLKNSTLNISNEVDNVLKNYELYYPLIDSMCGGNKLKCKIFTSKGLLMSNDGWHLTKEGAIESAQRIADILIKIKSK